MSISKDEWIAWAARAFALSVLGLFLYVALYGIFHSFAEIY